MLLEDPPTDRKPDLSTKTKEIVVTFPGQFSRRYRGRIAWTLEKLIAAGHAGITSTQLPAGLRLSHYIFVLRCEGVPIVTEREEHSGEFAGSHARYRLSAPVEVLEAA